MKVPPAQRITLAPLTAVQSDDALVEALATLSEVVSGERLALGAEIAAPNGLRFVVTGHFPPGREGVGPGTALELEPEGLKRRPSLDVLLLVDASYSMREALPGARRACEDFFRHAEDVAASAGLAIFRRDPLLVREFAIPANQSARVLDEVEARGPGDVAAALDWGLATVLARGSREHGKALLLITDNAAPDARRVRSVADRAQRLGVSVHVCCLARDAKPGALAEAAERTGGTYQNGSAPAPTLRKALAALAERVGSPLSLAEPEPAAPAEGGEVEFEIILKTMEPEEGPSHPWRRRE